MGNAQQRDENAYFLLNIKDKHITVVQKLILLRLGVPLKYIVMEKLYQENGMIVILIVKTKGQ